MQHVVLLRGINVGKSQRITMAALRSTLSSLGYEDVGTLLASGNAVIATAEVRPGVIARDVREALATQHHLDVMVMTRSHREWLDIIGANPFGDDADPGRVYVAVAADRLPNQRSMDAYVTKDVGKERFVVGGRELYVSCPQGVAGSVLLKELTERRVGVAFTIRNWNTVQRIDNLLGPAENG